MTLLSSFSSDEYGHIGIFETFVLFVTHCHVTDTLVGAVSQFHSQRLNSLLSLGDLNNPEIYLLVRSEHATLSDKMTDVRTNGTCGSRDCDINGLWIHCQLGLVVSTFVVHFHGFLMIQGHIEMVLLSRRLWKLTQDFEVGGGILAGHHYGLSARFLE